MPTPQHLIKDLVAIAEKQSALDIGAAKNAVMQQNFEPGEIGALSEEEKELLDIMFENKVLQIEKKIDTDTLSPCWTISLKPGNLSHPLLNDKERQAYEKWFDNVRQLAEAFKNDPEVESDKDYSMSLNKNSLGQILTLQFGNPSLFNKFMTNLRAKNLLPNSFTYSQNPNEKELDKAENIEKQNMEHNEQEEAQEYKSPFAIPVPRPKGIHSEQQ